MRGLLTFVFLLFTQFEIQARPTVESFFRHGPNPDAPEDSDAFVLMSVYEGLPEKDKRPLGHLHAYLYGRSRSMNQTKIFYSTSKQREGGRLLDLAILRNLKRDLLDSSQVRRNLFISLLYGLVFNSSDHMLRLLKQISPDVRGNQEVINQEKRTLLLRYKSYLEAKKRERGNLETPSPFAPQDPDERKKVRELLRGPYYKSLGQVKTVKKGPQFFWQAKTLNFEGLMDTMNHQLVSLSFRTHPDKVIYDFGSFILYDGIHSLPKMIHIRRDEDDDRDEGFSLRFEKLSYPRLTRGKLKESLKRWPLQAKGIEVGEKLRGLF